MKCAAVLAALVVACGTGSSLAATTPPPLTVTSSVSWADPQIRSIVAAGLLGPDVATFRPDDPLTRGELYDALIALGKPAGVPVDATRTVTMRELDAQLVSALELQPYARQIRIAARDAGLDPTPYLGTETVARLLGLRVNHPQDQEALERRPSDPASRAEAAYSFARLLTLQDWELQRIRDEVGTLVLPAFSDWQRRVVARAIHFVGYPYVFGGTSERPQELWSASGTLVSVPGGFDCSGLVWRVYKLQPFAGAPTLAGLLKGRTTYAMSGEVTPSARISLDALEPGDVVFFGPLGPRSRPAQVGHMGIYVGGGWFVHSSSAGVTLEPLTGWWSKQFAWGRRPLAEAGLSA